VKEPNISICIVTYHSKDLLRDCLQSLRENTTLDNEVIVVDNGSQDGVGQMLQQEFPGIQFLANDSNLGYTIPMNHALRQANGRCLLQLNPDTLILPQSLENLVEFLDAHPEAGICGPKVLNRDRSLQKPCRRGEPTPWAVLTYFLGLSKLFPKSRLFGQYLMSYMGEDETHLVAGVSGSCMLVRRAVIDQIGYLDERFFAYQEDADFCFRARQSGWQVYYVPTAQIVHFGGYGGSRVQPYRSIYEWHKSYFLYYRKHLAQDHIFVFNWFFYLAMLIKLFITLTINFMRKEKFAGSRKP